MGSRSITFSRELWIEETDFAEVPPKGFRRLTVPADGSPAKPVRLRYGYVIVPTSFEKDAEGRVTAVHANYLPETKSGTEGSMSVKTKATIHWLDAQTARAAEFRVYDRLFNEPNPEAGEGSFLDHLPPTPRRFFRGMWSLALLMQPMKSVSSLSVRDTSLLIVKIMLPNIRSSISL